MKPIVAKPTTTIETNGTITVNGGSDVASALNDVTYFSTATVADSQGNVYYGNAEHVDQFFTNFTQSTQPNVGTRSLHTTVGNPNDGSSGSFAATGGDTFVYVQSVEKTTEGQMVAILEGQLPNQSIFSPQATSPDTPFSEWLEVGATGLVPATSNKQTIAPQDFPLSALMLPQGTGNISSVMSPNLSFYNPPANKAVGQFFSTNISGSYIEGNAPLPSTIGNGTVAPMYVSVSADQQSLANLRSILPDATASVFVPQRINTIVVGNTQTQVSVSQTIGFSVGQTLTVSFELVTADKPVPSGWNCGKITSIDTVNNVIYTDLNILSAYNAEYITGVDERNFILPKNNVGFSAQTSNNTTYCLVPYPTTGLIPGMTVADITNPSKLSPTTFVESVGGSFFYLSSPTIGSINHDELVATGTSISANLSWSSGTTDLVGTVPYGTPYVGMYVIGNGIPAGSTITSISGSGTLTIVISNTTTDAGYGGEISSCVYDLTPSGGYYGTFATTALISNGSVLMSPVSQVQGSLLSGMNVGHDFDVVPLPYGTHINNPHGVEDAFVSGQSVTFAGTFASGTTVINVSSTTLSNGYSSSGMYGLSIGQVLKSNSYFPHGTSIIGMDTTAGTITVSHQWTGASSGTANFTTEPMYAQTFSLVGTTTSGSSVVSIADTNPSQSSAFYGLMLGTVISTGQLKNAKYTVVGINTTNGTITLSKTWSDTAGKQTLYGYNGYVYLSSPATNSGKYVFTVNYQISTAYAFGATIEGVTTRLNMDGGVSYDCKFFSAPYVSIDSYNNPNYGQMLILPVKPISVSSSPIANAIDVATIGTNNNFVSGSEKYANVFQSSTFVATFTSGSTSVTGVTSVKGTIREGSQLFVKGGSTGNLVKAGTQTGILTVASVSSDGTALTLAENYEQAGGGSSTLQIVATPPIQVADLKGISIGQAYASDSTTIAVSGTYYAPAVAGVEFAVGSDFYETYQVVDYPVYFTGDTSFNSAVITNIPSTQGLLVGMVVTGANLPNGTVIQSIDTANQITLSALATSSSTLTTFSTNYYNVYLGEYVAGTTDVFNGYQISQPDSYNTRVVLGEAVVGGSFYGTSAIYTMSVDSTTNLSVAPQKNWYGAIFTNQNGIVNVSESAISDIKIGDAVVLPYSVVGNNPESLNGYTNAFVSSIVSGGIVNGENVYTVFLEDNNGQPFPISYAPADGTIYGSINGIFSNYTPQYLYNQSRLVCLEINSITNKALMWAVDKPLPVGGKFVNTTTYSNGNNQNAIYPIVDTVPIASAFTTPTLDKFGAGVIALRGNINGNHSTGTAVASYDEGNRYFGSTTVGDLEVLSPTNIGSLFGTTLYNAVSKGSTTATLAPLSNTVNGTYTNLDQYGNLATQGFPITTGTSLKNCTVYSGNTYITVTWNSDPTLGSRPSVGWLVTGAGIPKNTFVTYVRGTEIGISNAALNTAVDTATFTFVPEVFGVMVVGTGDNQESVVFSLNYAFTSGQSVGNTTSPAVFQLASGQSFVYPHAAGEPVFVPNIKTNGFANFHAKEAPILGGADNADGTEGLSHVVADNTNGQVATTSTFTIGLTPVMIPVGNNNNPTTSATLAQGHSAGETSIVITTPTGFPDAYKNPYPTTNFLPPELGRLAGYTSTGTTVISVVVTDGPIPNSSFAIRIGTDNYYVQSATPSVLVDSLNAYDFTLLSPTTFFYYDGTPVHLVYLDTNSTYNKLYVPKFYLNRSFTGVLTAGSAVITSVVGSQPTTGIGAVYTTTGGTGGTNTLTSFSSPPQVGMKIYGDAAVQENTVILSYDNGTDTAVLSKPFTQNTASGSLWAAYEVQGEGIPAGAFIYEAPGDGTITLKYFTTSYGSSAQLAPAAISGTYTVNLNVGMPVSVGNTPPSGFTTLYTTPIMATIFSGTVISLSSPSGTDYVTVSADATVGSTSISIHPYTPTYAHDCASVSNGILTYFTTGVLGAGTICSYGLSAELVKGDPIVLNNGNGTTIALSVAQTPSANSTGILVEPFAPNYAYDSNPIGYTFSGTVVSGSNVLTTTSGPLQIGQQVFDGSGNNVFNGVSAFVQSVSTTTVTMGGGTTYYGGLENMVVGGDGNLYGFSNTGSVGIFKISPTGVVENFFPSGTYYFSNVYQSACAGSDGAIWYYSEYGTLLVRMSYSGDFTTYSTPWPTYQNGSLCLGPDGNLWTSGAGGAGYTSPTVYKVSTSGTFTAVPLIGDSITSVGNNIVSDGTYLYVADNNGTQRLLRWDTGGNASAHGVISGSVALLGNIAYDGTHIWMLGATGGQLTVASVDSSGTVTYYYDTTLTTGVSSGAMQWFYGFLVFNINNNIYIANIASFTSGSFTSEFLAPVSGELNFYCDNTNNIFWSWTGNSPTCELVGQPASGATITISPFFYNTESITEWLLNLSTSSVSDQSDISFYTNGTSIIAPPVYNLNDGDQTEQIIPSSLPTVLNPDPTFTLTLAKPLVRSHNRNSSISFYQKPVAQPGDTVYSPDTKALEMFTGSSWISSEISSVQIRHAVQGSLNGNDKVTTELLDTATQERAPLDVFGQISNTKSSTKHTVRSSGKRSAKPNGKKWNVEDLFNLGIVVASTTPAGHKTKHRSVHGVVVTRPKARITSLYLAPSNNVIFVQDSGGNYSTASHNGYTINWIYYDGIKTTAPVGYEVKIYDSQTASQTGFSPNNSTPKPIVDSVSKNPGTSFAINYQDGYVNGGTYIAYVRAIKQQEAKTSYTDWVSTAFTVTFVQPLPPIVAVWNDTSTATNVLSIQASDNLFSADNGAFAGTIGGWAITQQDQVDSTVELGIVGSVLGEDVVAGKTYTSIAVGSHGNVTARGALAGTGTGVFSLTGSSVAGTVSALSFTGNFTAGSNVVTGIQVPSGTEIPTTWCVVTPEFPAQTQLISVTQSSTTYVSATSVTYSFTFNKPAETSGTQTFLINAPIATDAVGFPLPGQTYWVTIGSEDLLVETLPDGNGQSNTIKIHQRGYNGTTPTPHAKGATVVYGLQEDIYAGYAGNIVFNYQATQVLKNVAGLVLVGDVPAVLPSTTTAKDVTSKIADLPIYVPSKQADTTLNLDNNDNIIYVVAQQHGVQVGDAVVLSVSDPLMLSSTGNLVPNPNPKPRKFPANPSGTFTVTAVKPAVAHLQIGSSTDSTVKSGYVTHSGTGGAYNSYPTLATVPHRFPAKNAVYNPESKTVHFQTLANGSTFNTVKQQNYKDVLGKQAPVTPKAGDQITIISPSWDASYAVDALKHGATFGHAYNYPTWIYTFLKGVGVTNRSLETLESLARMSHAEGVYLGGEAASYNWLNCSVSSSQWSPSGAPNAGTFKPVTIGTWSGKASIISGTTPASVNIPAFQSATDGANANAAFMLVDQTFGYKYIIQALQNPTGFSLPGMPVSSNPYAVVSSAFAWHPGSWGTGTGICKITAVSGNSITYQGVNGFVGGVISDAQYVAGYDFDFSGRIVGASTGHFTFDHVVGTLEVGKYILVGNDFYNTVHPTSSIALTSTQNGFTPDTSTTPPYVKQNVQATFTLAQDWNPYTNSKDPVTGQPLSTIVLNTPNGYASFGEFAFAVQDNGVVQQHVYIPGGNTQIKWTPSIDVKDPQYPYSQILEVTLSAGVSAVIPKDQVLHENDKATFYNTTPGKVVNNPGTPDKPAHRVAGNEVIPPAKYTFSEPFKVGFNETPSTVNAQVGWWDGSSFEQIHTNGTYNGAGTSYFYNALFTIPHIDVDSVVYSAGLDVGTTVTNSYSSGSGYVMYFGGTTGYATITDTGTTYVTAQTISVLAPNAFIIPKGRTSVPVVPFQPRRSFDRRIAVTFQIPTPFGANALKVTSNGSGISDLSIHSSTSLNNQNSIPVNTGQTYGFAGFGSPVNISLNDNIDPAFKLLIDWYDEANNYLRTSDGTESIVTGNSQSFNTNVTLPSSNFSGLNWKPNAIAAKAPVVAVMADAVYTPLDPHHPSKEGYFTSVIPAFLSLSQGTAITVDGVANGVTSKASDVGDTIYIKFPNNNGPKHSGGSYTLNARATRACPRIQTSNLKSGDIVSFSGLMFQALTPYLPNSSYLPLNTMLPVLTQTANPLGGGASSFAIPQTTPTFGGDTIYLFDPTDDNASREIHRGTNPKGVSFTTTTFALAGDKNIVLNNVKGLAAGSELNIGSGNTQEPNFVDESWDGSTTVVLQEPLQFIHQIGESVTANLTMITGGFAKRQGIGTPVAVFNWNNDGYINTPNTTYNYLVQRSDNGGINYTTLYNANNALADNTGVLIQNDVEVVPNAVTYYRVVPSFTDTHNNTVSGQSITGLPAPKLQTNSWWLGSTSDPALRFPVLVQNKVSETQKHPVGVFYPLGSSRPIVTAGVVQGRDATITIIWTDDAHWQDFISLLNLGETLVLTDPVEGERRYIFINDDVKVTHNSGGSPYREVSITYVEAPPPNGFGYTYGS